MGLDLERGRGITPNLLDEGAQNGDDADTRHAQDSTLRRRKGRAGDVSEFPFHGRSQSFEQLALFPLRVGSWQIVTRFQVIGYNDLLGFIYAASA